MPTALLNPRRLSASSLPPAVHGKGVPRAPGPRRLRPTATLSTAVHRSAMPGASGTRLLRPAAAVPTDSYVRAPTVPASVPTQPRLSAVRLLRRPHARAVG